MNYNNSGIFQWFDIQRVLCPLSYINYLNMLNLIKNKRQLASVELKELLAGVDSSLSV